MPLLETKGAGSAQGFGLTLGGEEPVYIEDVFSTYLYTGNGSTQTITNGIDLAGEGGLVWLKRRSASANHLLYDTVRGAKKSLFTNNNLAQSTDLDDYKLNSFSSNGFALGLDSGDGTSNASGSTYTSWSFQKKEKFFDVVTYTGNGSSSYEVAHNLGSAPGMVVCKKISGTGDWAVWHRGSGGNTDVTGFELNGTAAAQNNPAGWTTLFTSTTFRPTFVGSTNNSSNDNGATYVAYLFAHDAGGFGDDGEQNVISCGSFTLDSNGYADVNLGYEPQFIMAKVYSRESGWVMLDNMRGMPAAGQPVPPAGVSCQRLFAEGSGAESAGTSYVANVTSTGFKFYANNTFFANESFIYIAIRRGPMKVPESGTEVFSPTLATFSGTTVTDTGFVVDMVINKNGVATTSNNFVLDRLRGSNNSSGQITLPSTSSTSAEVASSGRVAFTGSVTIQNGFLQQDTTANNIVWSFGRAPGFFDVVCYTGTTSNLAVAHNLQVAPELMIIKQRGPTAAGWAVFADLTPTTMRFGRLDLTNSVSSETYANQGFLTGQPTASSFTLIGASGQLANNSSSTYVAYLFATLPGVSKVGSYTGTGTTLQIDCGFTGGARFVLIKRTDSTGDWYVWDTARGIVSGNDPYLLLNSTAAEVTSTDYIDPYSPGFEISSTAPAAINASGGSFIFLAIA